ncbi:MAG: amino acid adenylation domain-containing protein [Oscillospiraceae bacterium]|jgi:amino acid adenylation domain-containing protein/thioester reductase-like protein
MKDHPGELSVFPLSLNQRNIWDLEQAYPGTSINVISTTIRVSGRVNFLLLQKALSLVLEADASLRTRLTLMDAEPMQYHAPFENESFPLLDFSMTDEEGIEHWASALTREPMKLYDSPLCRFFMFRVNEETAGVLIKTHHIISDGWTQALLCNRIGETYLAMLAGEEPRLSESPDYKLHIEAEREYLASPAYKKDESFWRSELSQGFDPASLKSVRSPALSHVGRRRTYKLPQVLNHAIYSFCREKRVAPFAVFYMALAIYLRRTGSSRRFSIGVPVFNRTSYLYKQISGMFVSTLPFIGEVHDDWNLEEFCKALSESWFDVLRHQKFPFSHMVRFLPGEGPLFNIVLSYQDSRIIKTRDATVFFSGRWHYSGYQSEHLCIHVTNVEDVRHYCVDYDYLTQLFSEHDIDELHNYLCRIISFALEDPTRRLSDLPLLGLEERERVIYTFNRTDAPLCGGGLYEKFCSVVDRYPNRAAVIWRNERKTYGEIRDLGRRIAAALPEKGELVAVLLPRSPDIFAAMAGIMQRSCAWLLLPPDTPRLRLLEILRESGAGRVISNPQLGSGLGLPLIDIGNLPEPIEEAAEPEPDSLAYVVYTSGSTGKPKGAEIYAKSLLNLAEAMRPLYARGALLSVSGLGFDVFILESAAAMLNGRTVILTPEEDLESPSRLASLITGYGVGFISITPSRLSAFMKDPAFSASLRRLETIVCGGENFPGELLQRLRSLTSANIYNQYGPSETTVAVSWQLLNDAKEITIGRPMSNCRFYVLDSRRNPLPVGVWGDLYIGGICVGRGYRNDPDKTEECFLHSPFEDGERIYKTGDIACWTASGEIMLAGRGDSQIKLRGIRIEPQEIASRIAAHPDVNEAAVKVWESDGVKSHIIAYYVSAKPVPETELLAFAGEWLPHYMIPARILRLESMPLSPSGKIDMNLLPPPPEDMEAVQPSTALESDLLKIFRASLGRPDLHAGSDYFLSGGTSLNALETIGAIEEKTGVRLRVSDLYACRNAVRLAEFISGKGSGHSSPPPIPNAGKRDSYVPTPVQRGIYIESQLDPTGIAYNMPGAFLLPNSPDPERLEDAFRELISGDSVLRTSFEQGGGGIVARVSERVDFSLPVMTGDSLKDVFSQFLRPFDLSRAPLLRAALWYTPEGRAVLLLDVHHIICDGLSTPILLGRLDALYRGEAFPAPLTYTDYACFLEKNQEDESPVSYWRESLYPLPEMLELPTDYNRPARFDFRGEHINFRLSAGFTDKIEKFCSDNSITPFMFFCGVFGILLRKYSGQDDIIIGTPVSSRIRPELMEVCGPLIDTLPLRLRPRGPVSEYFSSVSSAVMNLLDNRGAPLEKIVAALDPPRSLDRSPLFQVIFSMRPMDASAFSFDGGNLVPKSIESGVSKFDLSLEAAFSGSQWSFVLEYASSLFSRGTMEIYARSFEALINSVLGGGSVEALETVSQADRLKYFDKPNRLFSPYLDWPLHRLVEEKAMLAPEAPAVIYRGETTDFGALIRRARLIAGLIIERGVVPGDRVALCCRRSPDMLAAMLGILIAGGAYVPFLSSYPKQRISYMLENSGSKLLLCDEESKPCLPEEPPCPVVLLSEKSDMFTGEIPRSGSDPIYVLYTSGSTGQPKGVQVPHRAISNLLESIRELMEPHSGPVLCSTNITFDIFITESLLALAQGFAVVLADEEEMMLPWRLAELIIVNGASIAQFTPSRLQMCLTNEAFREAASVVEFIIVAGEALSPHLVDSWYSFSKGCLINMYGPTEAAVYVTQGEMQKGGPVTIGRPLRNCRIYVLGQDLKPLPPTAVGELWLAGECLADGYIGRPELTEKVFLPDPFFPGRRMYRSGDLGRIRSDGLLECLGRIDSQIKLNGVRVELGEVTGALTAAGATEAAVLPVKNPDGSASIVAFISPEILKPELVRSRLEPMLPQYMMPSEIHVLPSLPYNSSGKIDLPRLREMRTELSSEQDDEICAETENKPDTAREDDIRRGSSSLRDIWLEVLGRNAVDPGISFFSQGGTSLGALNVLSRYFNLGLSMTLAEFYANPTLEAQERILLGSSGPAGGAVALPASSDNGSSHAAEAAEPSPSAIAGFAYPSPKAARLPEEPASEPRLSIEAPASGASEVLLTGATGFLGCHLLRLLVERGETVLCTLRDGNTERLLDTLGWYFGSGWVYGNRERIKPVRGDITLPLLGLSEAEFEALKVRIKSVFHAAADVRHYTDGISSESVNFIGTRNIIGLAMSAGVPLNHISTTSVSGSYLKSSPGTVAVFTENDLDIGQNWDENVYTKTKYLAECAVFDSAKRGLVYKIFRVGRLVGRDSDGVFMKNPETNAFWLLVRGLLTVGAIPESIAEMPVDLTPVDICAEAILTLSESPSSVFHIMSPYPLALREVFPSLPVLPDSSFDSRVRASDPDKTASLVNYLNSFRRMRSCVKVSAEETVRLLGRTGFSWPKPQVSRLLASFTG